MGRLLLVCRLAARDARRRPAEAALLLLAIVAATTTLTLGLVLHGVTDEPYQSTRQATAGPDVVAGVRGDPVLGEPADLAALQALADAPGVTDYSGPYPFIGVELEADGVTASRPARGGSRWGGGWAQGRDPAAAAVDQPELTQGGWVRDGGVVIEAGFADALDLGVGDEIPLWTRSVGFGSASSRTVVWCTAAPSRLWAWRSPPPRRPYPDVNFGLSFPEAMDPWWLNSGPPGEEPAADAEAPVDPVEPGLVWLTEADARGLAPTEAGLSYVMNLKLADPTDAPAFANDRFPTSWTAPALHSWQDIRDGHDEVVKDTAYRCGQPAGCLACSPWPASGPRRRPDGHQTRRVGLLEAVGGTPRLVAVVLLAE